MDGLILPILIFYFSAFFFIELKKLECPPDLKPGIGNWVGLISAKRREEYKAPLEGN